MEYVNSLQCQLYSVVDCILGLKQSSEKNIGESVLQSQEGNQK